MAKKFIALLLVLCLVIPAAPIFVGAAAVGANISATTTTVKQGDYAYIYVNADAFEGIASLDLYLYYDSNAMTVNSVSNGSMLSGAQVSVNKSKLGEIKLSAISLDGMSGSGRLLSVTFQIKSDAPAGDYPIRLAVGDSYDVTLSPTSVKCTNGSITVNERVYTETFYVNGYPVDYRYNYSKGDVLEYRVDNNNSYSFTGAEFSLEYDYEIFEFVSADLAAGLKNDGALYSVNSSTIGKVRITYASVDPVNSYNLFNVKLRVIADTDVQTTLKATAQNVYREDLTPYISGSSSNTITIKKLPEVIDHPDLYLVTDDLIAGESATSTLYLEKGAGVAAGDFCVSYDPSVFRCVDVTAADIIGDYSRMIVINDKFAEGKIRFSYINMDAYDEMDIPLINITWEPITSPDEHYKLSLSGVGVVDAQQNEVTLEYVEDSDCIHVRRVIEPDCLNVGKTTYTCGCGDSYEVDIVPALGHDVIHHIEQAPNCTEIGWHEYETCSRCDYSTYVEIPASGHSFEDWKEVQAPTCLEIGTERRDCINCDYYEIKDIANLGHDEIYHEAREVTCTEIGWHEYVTCSRCDYSTYEEIAALGHDEVYHEAREVTCTDIGWNDYVTCRRCDYTTYEEIAALGHDEIFHDAKDPNCTEIGWYDYVTCSRCEYSTYIEIPATGHSYEDKICVNCGEDQPPSYSWDVSVNADGSVMAYAYKLTDGNYLLEFVGNGDMANWSYSTPWSSIGSKITEVVITEGVTSIGDYAFYGCTNIKNAEIAEGVTYIGQWAFYSSGELRTIYLPDSVETIGYAAFYESKKLTIILEGDDMPSNLGSIWNYGCGYYLDPQDVIVNEDSTYVVDRNGIGYLAKYVGNADSFEIAESIGDVPVTHIGDSAFNNASNLVIFTVPKEIKHIGENAFRGCTKITIILESESLPGTYSGWNGDSPYYISPNEVIIRDGFTYVIDRNGTLYLAKYHGKDYDVVVPSEIDDMPILHIGNNAFYQQNQIASITLPDSILTIGDYAFRSCWNMKQIHLPSELQYLGREALWYCRALKEVVIPEGLAEIKDDTFGYCESLTEITIPESVELIYSNAFNNCTKLALVRINSVKIAESLTGASACGYLISNAVTVIVPDSAERTAYMDATYPTAETALIDGEYYVIYSTCEHTWIDNIVTEMEECVLNGLIHHTCSACGVRKDTVISCHDEVIHSAKAPTCTDFGWNEYVTCSRCGYTSYEEIEATGHCYMENVVAPGCTEGGYTEHICSSCGDYYISDITEAVGHSYKGGICINCGHSISGDINGDGKLNISDIFLIKSYLSGNISFDEVQFAAADMNGDNKVNIMDIYFAKSYIIGA